MKWHKISDGDYPERTTAVVVALMNYNGEYHWYDCTTAMLDANRIGEVCWFMTDTTISVSPTDRWTYIDLPTD